MLHSRRDSNLSGSFIWTFNRSRNSFPGPTGRGQTTIELYNLKTDIGEQNNLADEYPEIVERMLRLIEYYRETLGQGNKKPGTEVRPAAEFNG